MLRLIRYLAIRPIALKPFRTLLVVLGIALGISLFVSIQAINRSTLKSFHDNIDAVMGKASLTISAGDAGFPEADQDIVQNLPSVKHAVPMISARGYLVGKSTSETLMILGVDMLRDQTVRSYQATDEEVIDDPLVFLNQPDSIILTREFALDHHFELNSHIELATADGKKTFTVRGLLTSSGAAKAYGGAVALMDIDGARVSFGKIGKLDRIDVVLRDGIDVEQAQKEIQERLGSAYSVDRPASQLAQMQKLVKSFQVMLTLFSFLALMVGLFLVTNSVSIAVAERKKEIGIIRALGVPRKYILVLFLTEAAVFGLVGSSVGVLIGRVLANGMVRSVTDALKGQLVLQTQVPHVEFELSQALLAIGVGTIACLVAAFWPSYRATRISPLDAITSRSSDEANSKETTYLPLIGLILLVLSCLGMAMFQEVLPIGMHTLLIVLSLGGAVLVGPSIAAGFTTIAATLSRWCKAGAVARIAIENLERNRRRTANNVSVLMIGLSFVVIIGTVNASFRTTIMDWLGSALSVDLLVSGNGKIITLDVPPMQESFGKELEKIPGIAIDESGRGAYGLRFIHLWYQGEQIALKAFDTPSAKRGYSSIIAIDRDRAQIGHDLFEKERTVAISQGLAHRFKIKTGDSISLPTPSGTTSFTIVGVVTDFASPVGVVYISRDTYKKYWQDHLVATFSLFVAPGTTPEALRQKIDKKYGRSNNVMVTLNQEVLRQMSATVDQSFAFLGAVEAVALLVGMLGILNTVLVSVMERTREIGLLRAVGMSRRQVFEMIMREVTFQGLLGGMVSVGLGTFVAYIWLSFSLTQVLGWMVQFHYAPQVLIKTFLGGILVACLAGLLPSKKAASLEIRDALAYE